MLADFKITEQWPPAHPELLQLYSLATPNGVKVSILLEETGLPYEAHRITLDQQGVLSPAFLSLNPNNKIPAIIDPDGPDGKPLALFESGAILLYLAEKTGQFRPRVDHG
jgi:GST-like protein